MDKLIKQFTKKAEALSAEVFRYQNLNSVYDKIAEIVVKEGAQVVGCVPEGFLQKLPQRLEKNNISVLSKGSPQEIASQIDIGVIEAQAGIAETGTIVQNATNLFARYFSMLPSTSIVVLETSKIKPVLFEALQVIQGKDGLPGFTAFISGPSRTADIERVLTIGVHGPGRLIILLVDEGDM